MRHARSRVFFGAFMALVVMSFLSAMLGHVVPTLLPRKWTTIAACGLFLVFGAKMMQEGLAMESGTGAIEEELREVTKEIEENEVMAGASSNKRMLTGASSSGVSRNTEEDSSSLPAPVTSSKGKKKPTDGIINLLNLVFSPIVVQTFILTFLAEWGDRSQITTIALGAAHVCLLVHASNDPSNSFWNHRTSGLSLSVQFSVMAFAHWALSWAVVGSLQKSASNMVCFDKRSKSSFLFSYIHVLFVVTLGGAALFLIFGVVYGYEAVRILHCPYIARWSLIRVDYQWTETDTPTAALPIADVLGVKRI